MRTIGVVLFPGFELLDVYGPLEILGMWPDQFQLRMVAETSPATESGMGPASVVDDLFSDDKDYDALLIPGGAGTRTEVNNPIMLDWLKRKSEAAEQTADWAEYDWHQDAGWDPFAGKVGLV